jgi:hypothetical protein
MRLVTGNYRQVNNPILKNINSSHMNQKNKLPEGRPKATMLNSTLTSTNVF